MTLISNHFDNFNFCAPGDPFLLTDVALNWIKTVKRKKPFFLWLHYLQPHEPYSPPLFYSQLFINDGLYKSNKKIPLSKEKDSYYSYKVISKFVAKDNIEDVDFYISQYDAEIRYADDAVGKLLLFLRKNWLDKNTVIIFTADHGSSLGEHDLWFCHGGKPYDEVIRIPLIISYPQKLPQGIKINELVSSIDIAPTVLTICRIKVPDSMKGENLLPLLLYKKKETNFYFNRKIFAEYKDKFHKFFSTALRTSEWKLICNNQNKYELYNLENDPQELINLVDIEKDKFDELKKELDNFMHGSSTSTAHKESVDKSTIDSLRSLGYLH